MMAFDHFYDYLNENNFILYTIEQRMLIFMSFDSNVNFAFCFVSGKNNFSNLNIKYSTLLFTTNVRSLQENIHTAVIILSNFFLARPTSETDFPFISFHSIDPVFQHFQSIDGDVDNGLSDSINAFYLFLVKLSEKRTEECSTSI